MLSGHVTHPIGLRDVNDNGRGMLAKFLSLQNSSAVYRWSDKLTNIKTLVATQ